MARAVSATAGALRAGAAPIARRMPRSVAFTISLLVGGSWPASLWAYLIALLRRPMVEGFQTGFGFARQKARHSLRRGRE